MVLGVSTWWTTLCVVSVLNMALWVWSARRFQRTGDRARLPHLWLSGCYVLVCAFRSLLPRADVQRIVLVDSFLSSVAVGRTVATVAELCFVAQWALLLHELSRSQRSRPGVLLSYAIVPAIAVAEICSWYAVLSTNFLGNALEQSIWTLTALLVGLVLVPQWWRAAGSLRGFLGAIIITCLGFVLFMSTVDVPMYLTRWQADTLAGRAYLPLADGLRDVASRWVVTHALADWHEEMAWMALYFSAAVWMSIGLAHAPRIESARLLRLVSSRPQAASSQRVSERASRSA